MFCGSRLLVAYLRPSNIDPSLHTRVILKLLVTRLRQAWPKVRLVLRADSGFARFKLLRWCEKNSVFYVVGRARNKVLERLAAPFMESAERQYAQTQQKVRNFHQVRYAARTWDRQRRVIVKAERLPRGPNVRFVLTNLDAPPAMIYDQRYTPRGDMENRIKEQQLMLFADRASCHGFPGKSVPLAAQCRRLPLDRAPPADHAEEHEAGSRPGGHHSAEALQGRGPGGVAPVQCLSPASPLPSGPPAASGYPSYPSSSPHLT